MGDPSNVDDGGLVDKVKDNTRFRLNVKKSMAAIWAAISLMGSKILYGWWMKEGG